MDNIFAISPLDGRYAESLTVLSPLVSEFALLKYRIKVECAWFKFLLNKLKLHIFNDNELNFIDALSNNFNYAAGLRIKAIESITKHDVKAVEYYLKEQISTIFSLKPYSEFIHFACTSEDINNISYALMLQDLKTTILLPQLNLVYQKLLILSEQHRAIAMISRTHGQSATPTTMGKELYNSAYRLARQIKQLENQEILAKINGAVGNYNAHRVAYPDINWPQWAQEFIEQKLGLNFNPCTTQIEPHDYMAEIFAIIKRANNIMIDLTRDLWTYISLTYFKQKISIGQIGSSTMPHKINPIDFENSEGNFGVANSLLSHFADKLPISRLQRDLSDSTVQRNIGSAIAYTILAIHSLLKGLNKLEINQIAINIDLDNNWELLAEAIQTVMRKYGIKDSYEQLKNFTQGKKITKNELKVFIKQLDLPEAERDKLLALTPHNYIGYAKNF